MRRLVGPVAGLFLTIALAPAAAAVQPDIFRDAFTFTGVSGDWSAACGFTVTTDLTSRFAVITQSDGSYDVHVTTRRTLTGPGGSVLVVSGYSFGADQQAESFVDETTGLYTEIYRETYRGTITVSEAGTGIVSKTAGWLYSTVTIAYPDGADPIVTVDDAMTHGIEPSGLWGSNGPAICAALA